MAATWEGCFRVLGSRLFIIYVYVWEGCFRVYWVQDLCKIYRLICLCIYGRVVSGSWVLGLKVHIEFIVYIYIYTFMYSSFTDSRTSASVYSRSCVYRAQDLQNNRYFDVLKQPP